MSVNLPRGSIIRNGILYNGGAGGSFFETTPVTALSGATTVTIQDSHIHATSLVIPFADDGTSVPMAAPSSMTLTEGQCVLTVDALATDTEFTLVILSGSGSGGGGGASHLYELSDVDISNPTNGQVLAYNGTTQKWVNISLINDTTASASTVYSSSKVDTTYAKKSDLPVWTSTVTALTGATSATIQDANITTNSVIECFANVQGLGEPEMTITTGQCVLTFSALAQDTTFKLRVTN